MTTALLCKLLEILSSSTETLVNSLGFVPAVEIFNYMDCTGESTGNGEFDWLANQILYHDELVRNIRKNLKFFGNPTLVSSRPRHDLLESGDENSFQAYNQLTGWICTAWKRDAF